MPWKIVCRVPMCRFETTARNIADLLCKNRSNEGWFICSQCNARGHIEKSFELQEGDQCWEPHLMGAILLPDSSNETYKPFAFLVGEHGDEFPSDIWVSYYKDMRPQGGRLQLGYGPGGPPVLKATSVVDLVAHMLKCIKPEIAEIVREKLASALD